MAASKVSLPRWFSALLFALLLIPCFGVIGGASDAAFAAGPAAGSSLTVLALEPKTVRKKEVSHRRVRTHVAAANIANKPGKARSAKSSTVKSAAAKVPSARRGSARNSSVRLASAKSKPGRIRVKHVRMKNVTLDDALQSPPADEAVNSVVVRQRFSAPPALTFSATGLPVANSMQSLIDAADATGNVQLPSGETITLTIDRVMQNHAESLLLRNGVPWGALVAMDPRTGAIKAAASYSTHEPGAPEVATRGGFPAASLFKIITTAAGVDKAGLEGDDMIAFRGGNYTLSLANYVPDARKDRRFMSLSEALGRSCNPVFARVALQKLTPTLLKSYAERFGFNQSIPFDAPLALSQFTYPDDHYSFARTAAGFGEVTITPVQAVSVMSAIANGGVMMRPHLISRITGGDGQLSYVAKNAALRSVVKPETARDLLNMMQSTVEIGTARRGFRGSSLADLPIAGKTGTLTGDNPKGVYHWFVAAIPADNPELTISVLVINPGYSRANTVQIGRQFLERSYHRKPVPIEAKQERPAADERAGIS